MTTDFDKKISHMHRSTGTTKAIDGVGAETGLDTMAEDASATRTRYDAVVVLAFCIFCFCLLLRFQDGLWPLVVFLYFSLDLLEIRRCPDVVQKLGFGSSAFRVFWRSCSVLFSLLMCRMWIS